MRDQNDYNQDNPNKRRRKRVTRPGGTVKKITQDRPPQKPENEEVRLNKYISNCGVCSRREADTLIQDGKVKVNGEVITTMGHKVLPTDEVEVNGEVISTSRKIYVLLNKPKDYITTTNDPQNRRTVMDLIEDLDADRVYPVGRLDRNTTGILIFTNDGELSQLLMHPKSNVTKIYSVELTEPLSMPHYYKLQKGINLFDGFMKPDKLAFVDESDHKRIGVEIHSGRNRIVRRMFEALGYEVVKLDRVIYGGLDKAGLTRGKWRILTEKEIHQLKRVAGMR
ncbi:MAG: rRNA pseudouridine synthase [Flavobacteriales bacterium]|nr:rRNA pseudouridine synthase [Bacteroidota bacterium]MCB9241313.1 rRNA pseudouridine synthase [Flavobacteriales bacterium]